ncbi:MAG: SAM-dependent methyltransferase [Phycisphaerae bacterium]|nr:SAM-dependent methyltransferase [Phycisphaerae bacterium]
MTTTMDWRRVVLDAVADEQAFLRLTLSGPTPQRKEASPHEGYSTPDGAPVWEKVSCRPVMVGGRRGVQMAYSAGKRHITKNFEGAALQEELDTLLSVAMGFSQISVQTTTGDIHVRISRKGKALISRGKPSRREGAAVLEHNRAKSYPLPPDRPDEFLRAIGIASADGRVKSAMVPKFRQINEFLRVIEQVLPRDAGGTPAGHAGKMPASRETTSRPLHLIDCGCGNAYLTFAAYHYVRHVKGIPARVTGVDINADLIANCRRLAASLGWQDELEFHVSPIADFSPPQRPDLVVSLHACDTATDDALAQAVRWNSRAILAAPCCQHELHDQLDEPTFAPLLRHGILRQRLADLLTDSFRASALRIVGYRTRVFEFISPEHTGKNLLIEARRIEGADDGRNKAIEEYRRLRTMWNIQPAIERLLGIDV